ncbi:hypothetical protein VTK73DRAFT_8131 [Phialemonium thermophilum]|uniref:Association with the SNF1 complex (ASC) domain-containing protein n=1 Tax=Phialemonium thermophilum TaxID=223376 RepID=A0ABR3XQ23_9PEZI
MGNNPSSTAKQPSAPSSQGHQESPRLLKRDIKHPIPVHNQRVAAPPEPSLAQAQGTTTNTRSAKPLQPRPISSLNNSSASSTPASSVASARPIEARQWQDSVQEPTKPVAVPVTHNSPPSPLSPHSADPFDAAAMAYNAAVQDIYQTRPPRLPLPIEEEIHTPGSPILAPADAGQPLEEFDGLDDDGLGRRSSGLSTTTIEDEDSEELRVDKTRPTVPTRLEWRRGGEKVYVTGTIFQWNRKTRLHPVEGQPGVFAATIHILPGTHHIRFLVDGQMQTSPDLPTTVDFGNNLVNYIEVSPDDVPAGRTGESEAEGVSKDAKEAASSKASPSVEGQDKPPRDRTVPAADQFSTAIPKYLLDFDQPEDSPLYQSAVAAVEKLPTPPSLPGFLSKPILNAATLMKDDNSVLNMPNYTVLNHLATSSIKNNTLAVSATTRYKHKYVTTIIYKPTSQEGS